MSHYSLPEDPKDIRDLYNALDNLHAGAIDTLAGLEGGNWGCPVEGTEEIRAILAEISDRGFPMLEAIEKLAEYMEGGTDEDFRKKGAVKECQVP